MTRTQPTRALVRRTRPYLSDVDQVEIDLCGPIGAITEALRDVGTVVHLAGENEVVAATEPDRALTATIMATRHFAAAAAAAGVERVVYASTVHVYGTRLQPGADVDEETAPQPTSEYAIARLASEHLLSALTASGIDVLAMRLTNVVGAPLDVSVDRWTLVTNDLCRQAVTTGRLRLKSSGHQYRDFVAASDVEDLLAATTNGSIPAGTYNVGSGQPTTIRELAGIVQDRMEARTGTRPPLDAPPLPDGPTPPPYHVIVDRVRGAGPAMATPLPAAVDETVAFCLAQEDALRNQSATPARTRS